MFCTISSFYDNLNLNFRVNEMLNRFSESFILSLKIDDNNSFDTSRFARN